MVFCEGSGAGQVKKKESRAGYGKIFEAWVPTEDAGDPVGCLATTFTFNPSFFEEECLGRFLQLESDAAEDGPAYLVEREEKLAQLACASVLVDQHHARGIRSLRWDLIPARPLSGIQHAKVSLLHWSRKVRLIVASANLTEDGYRRNLEVFGVVDYFEGSESPLIVLDDILAFLEEVASEGMRPEEPAGPALSRWRDFLRLVKRATRSWGAKEYPRRYAKPHVHAVLSGPGRASVLDALRQHWPETSPPTGAFVLSPFFDPPESRNEPAKELWSLLRQRGEATVNYLVTAEAVPGTKALLLHAPESLMRATPDKRGSTETQFERLKLDEGRPLHAKCIWLENNRGNLYLMGSSNFTSAGLGIGNTSNWEANLAYAVNGQTNRKMIDALYAAWPDAEDIPRNIELRWLPKRDEDEDPAVGNLLPLPIFFKEATYSRTGHAEGRIHFLFSGYPPPGWKLFLEDGKTIYFPAESWELADKPNSYTLPWPDERPPAGLQVTWEGCAGQAWLPVNILDAASLPPPSELKDLPLEVLIDILTSARPLHLALSGWLRRTRNVGQESDAPALDPHKRVDTSSFLLQRTRRISQALTALRARLERPVVSEQALAWRIHGPIGVKALAQAIEREARSEAEKLFLLAELCLELSRVRPQETPGSLGKVQVRKSIAAVIEIIRQQIPSDLSSSEPEIARYCEAVFREAIK